MTGLPTKSVIVSGTLLGALLRGRMPKEQADQYRLEIHDFLAAMADLPPDAKLMEVQEIERQPDRFVIHWMHPTLTGQGRGEARFYAGVPKGTAPCRDESGDGAGVAQHLDALDAARAFPDVPGGPVG